ncbi:hypothetical protein SASPL_120352 [Salvia splendens]|uniref:Clp R domain-containing protein n=1 Tax=Salvia splendens TaxID=180675 RepID=A0A8X8ZV67_SALSN|nr:hypothetical protein SASPL_120352 [Salvia splendens]
MATQGLSVLSITPISSAAVQSRTKHFEEQVLNFNPPNTFLGAKLSTQLSNLSLVASKRRGYAVATISFSLPNTKTEGLNTDKKAKWSARSIKSFAMGELEARKLKYPNTGTEALLMGILVEGTSLAAKFLRENGITIFKERDEIALDWAVEEKLKSGTSTNFFHGLSANLMKNLDFGFEYAGESGEITVTHILLGIWSQKESAGYKILAGFGFDDTKAAELAKNVG